jgi:hypothetical protein
MRRKMLPMIAPTSLSALSVTAGTGGLAGTQKAAATVQPARAQSAAPALSAQPSGRTSLPSGVNPGQTLPRGSLLDLSV